MKSESRRVIQVILGLYFTKYCSVNGVNMRTNTDWRPLIEMCMM